MPLNIFTHMTLRKWVRAHIKKENTISEILIIIKIDLVSKHSLRPIYACHKI